MPWTIWIATLTSALYTFFAALWLVSWPSSEPLARVGMLANVIVPAAIAIAFIRRARFAPSLTLFAILGFMSLLGASQNPAVWPTWIGGPPARILSIALLVLLPATPLLMLLPASKRYFASPSSGGEIDAK